MEKKIKYLIVEDEEKSREILLKKIQMCSIPDILCTGMAANASEALLLSKMTAPDFLLLDINLPGKNGFDLIRELNCEGIFPEVIFTSAHTESEILLNALKHSPVTYLVKPIDLDELEEAIRKVCEGIRLAVVEGEIENKIRFQGTMGPAYILPCQLLLVRADGHYSKLFLLNGKELMIRQSISEVERLIMHPYPKMFIKPDRSTILNLTKIIGVHNKMNECVLASGNETLTVKISANGIQLVLKAMNGM